MTLSQLIAETYAENETGFYGFEDRGNGSAWPPNVRRYDEQAAADYGQLEMQACEPIKAQDGSDSEFVYASEWISGENGYAYRILF